MDSKHIAFEGPSGSGKTTLSKLLTFELNRQGLAVVRAKSPNGTVFGKNVANAIFSGRLTSSPEFFGFIACFSQLVAEVIRPALADGKWIVSDRGVGTVFAYALYRRKGFVKEASLREILTLIGQGNEIWPDITFFLDIPIRVGFRRKLLCNDRSRFDLLNANTIEEAKGLSILAERFNWFHIDAMQPIESALEKILEKLELK